MTKRVALVAGATRGGGRGAALALAQAGFHVWCTGRSTTGALASGDARPETVDETVALIRAAGGQSAAARCDHTQPDELAALAARVRQESGRLDVLVDSVWGGDALIDFGDKPWTADPDKSKTLIERGLTSHVLTARALLPLMIESKARLLVEVGDGHQLWYRGHLGYDLVKVGIMRLAYGLSIELKEHGIAAVCVTPGFLRSEAMLDHFGVTKETWRDGAAKDPHFIESETPAYLGRAIAALAADPDVMKKTGRALHTGGLAEEYGFVDEDGRKPHWPRYFEKTFPEMLEHSFGG